MLGNIIAAIIIGIIAGYLGRALLPGKDSMGFIATVLVGIAGALVGYFVFTGLLGIGDTDKFDLGGIVGAIIGTMIVLLLLQKVLVGIPGEQLATILLRILPLVCIWGGIYWLIALPYVFVAFGSEFFRERVRGALHLTGPQEPAAPEAEASEEQQVGEAR
jgi:uncharacterized membrane protein YeaQ/YmgE (transglycosylase-associated protein family)